MADWVPWVGASARLAAKLMAWGARNLIVSEGSGSVMRSECSCPGRAKPLRKPSLESDSVPASSSERLYSKLVSDSIEAWALRLAPQMIKFVQ